MSSEILSMKQYAEYVLWGLVFILPGEFFLQVLTLPGGLAAFKNTIATYIVFLTVLFIVQRIVRRNIKKEYTFILFSYLLWGSVGLFLIEWLLLSNSPWLSPNANQISMFTWWGMVSIFSILMAERKTAYPVKKYILILWLLLALFTIIPTLLSSGIGEYIGHIVFSYGTIVYNYFLYTYLKSLRK